MRILRTVACAVLLGALATEIAGAQVNYTTQGFFSGSGISGLGCTTVAAATATCSGGGFTLVFNASPGVNLANGTVTSFGTFNLTGTGTVTVPPGAVFFTLLVNQTTPTGGQATFTGMIAGTVSTAGGNFSSLVWSPNQFGTVGSTHYEMIYDNVGPGANIGLGIPINNTRGISALVTTTTTPEPATVTLLLTGVAALVPVAIRRRRNSRQ